MAWMHFPLVLGVQLSGDLYGMRLFGFEHGVGLGLLFVGVVKGICCWLDGGRF